jgi:glycosyltransferase involved in cell wall biosynthesis
VKPDDVDELAKGIIKLVRDDKLRNQLSINGREKAMRLFNSENNYQKLLSLILRHP